MGIAVGLGYSLVLAAVLTGQGLAGLLGFLGQELKGWLVWGLEAVRKQGMLGCPASHSTWYLTRSVLAGGP